MRQFPAWLAAGIILVLSYPARAADAWRIGGSDTDNSGLDIASWAMPSADQEPIDNPLFADISDDNSVYATPPPPNGSEGVNNGAVHFGLDVSWVNRYVYRGVDHDTVATHGNSLNLLFQGTLSFDLGKYPHPFVGLFTNIYDADPVSRFQEIRPYVGLTWNLRPILLEAGHIEYIFPQREQFNIPEIYLKIGLDDSLLYHTEQPILSPYIMAAYDYYRNEGWYLETGVKHDFLFEDYGLTITPSAAVAWISGLEQQFVVVNRLKTTGWQHVEVGMTITYSLNTLLNVSTRYGEFDVKAYGFYDGRLSQGVTANNVAWGGVGISFKY